jgi:hypothetical protein
VLPAAAFFRLAHVSEALIFLRYGQQKIATQFEERFDRLSYVRHFRNIDDRIWDTWFRLGRPLLFSYVNAFHFSQVGYVPPTHPVVQSSSLLDRMFDALNPRYNRIAIEAHDLKNSTTEKNWDWSVHPEKSSASLHKHYYSNGLDSTLEITSSMPVMLSFSDWLWRPLLLAIAALLGGAAVLFLFLRWLFAALLHLDLRISSDNLPTFVNGDQHSLILIRSFEPEFEPRPAYACELDIAAALTGGPVTPEELEVGEAPGSVVWISNFDHQWSDPESTESKLRILEWLVYRTGSTVLLPTRVEPLRFLELNDLPASQIGRWRSVLRGFQRYAAPADPMVPAPVLSDIRLDPEQSEEQHDRIVSRFDLECTSVPALRRICAPMSGEGPYLHTPEQVTEDVLDRASALYARIWDCCSEGERRVLYRLVHGGILDLSRRSAVQELQRKGLIIQNPIWRCVSPSFRRYVIQAASGDTAITVNTDDSNGWTAVFGGAKALLAGIALVIVIALIVGQRETLQSSIGVIISLVGAITGLTRTLSGRVESGTKAQNG